MQNTELKKCWGTGRGMSREGPGGSLREQVTQAVLASGDNCKYRTILQTWVAWET